jgi:flagellar basal-body rod protein FlgC
MQVSASGMAAQRMRTELLVQNIANSETTRTPEGGPYRRQDVVFSTELQSSPFSAVFQNEVASGVSVSDIVQDQREPERRYLPGHPDADANGYVAFPRMNPAEDMADLLNASRSYQANVAAISAVKDMISRSIEIMK